MRCSCMLCLLLFFLLHLSSSVSHATSRNHRRLFAVAVAVPAASPSTALYGDDHTTAMHVWRSPRRYMQASAAMAAAEEEKRGSPPPPLPDGLGLQPGGGVEGAAARTTEEEVAGAAMAPFPAAAEVGGKDDDSGGGEQHDGAADDAGIDYAPPKTHPPSHN
uniref:Uncharacterized protein n=1 Tax=Oryza punctata TaxID=4537 RepID=A0A0E0LRD8_ORYPU